MKRLLNLERVAQLFFELEEAERDVEPGSEPESEGFDDEMDVLSFVVKEESGEEGPPTRPPSATRWYAQPNGRRGSPARSRSPLSSEPWKTKEESEDFDYERGDRGFVVKEESEEEEPPSRAQSDTWWSAQPKGRRDSPARSRSRSRSRSPPSSEPWKTKEDADTAPAVRKFQPRRPPGVQVKKRSLQSPKDLFLQFFATDPVRTVCNNTNKNAAKNKQVWEEHTWTDVEPEEMYQFFGLLIYISWVSMPSLGDYWRQNHILSVPLPAQVMTMDRFRSIFRNLYFSDPDVEVYKDKLFRGRPLYDDVLRACQVYYHPRRELVVAERMEATTGVARRAKDKPTKRGMKFFVLAESGSGYTFRFNIHTGKPVTASEHGLPYDVVMNLIEPYELGNGYHVYMDTFYTSPKLFRDLASMGFGACGPYRESRKGFPRGRANALTKTCQRGSVRWIREGPIVFVKWMDTQEVSACSTIHPAFSGETLQRRVKDEVGRRTVRDIPCPTPIMAYNKNMGGVDLSDQLIQCDSTHRTTTPWYKTMLMHFLDIAASNAFILHRERSIAKKMQPKEHKDFLVELVCQLCGTDTAGISLSRRAHHIPVPILITSNTRRKASKGRLKCRHCYQAEIRNDTPWKCKECNAALCLVMDRNCFLEWHK